MGWVNPVGVHTMRLTMLCAIAAASLLTGCVTERPVRLPNGTDGWAIRCPGVERDIGDCMNEAARLCGGKYYMLDRDGNVAGGVATQVGNSSIFVQGIHRTLIVSCQPPSGQGPR